MSELTYPARLQGLSIPLAGGATYAAGPWHVLVQTRVIGAGELDFKRAVQRITSWQMHRGAGVRIDADSDAAAGVEVAMRIGAACSTSLPSVESWSSSMSRGNPASLTERWHSIRSAVRRPSW